MVYELCTGRPPFDGTSLMEIVSRHVHAKPHQGEIPNDIWQLIEQCLEKTPDHRYQSFDEVVRDLVALEHLRSARIGIKWRKLMTWSLASALLCIVAAGSFIALNYREVCRNAADSWIEFERVNSMAADGLVPAITKLEAMCVTADQKNLPPVLQARLHEKLALLLQRHKHPAEEIAQWVAANSILARDGNSIQLADNLQSEAQAELNHYEPIPALANAKLACSLKESLKAPPASLRSSLVLLEHVQYMVGDFSDCEKTCEQLLSISTSVNPEYATAAWRLTEALLAQDKALEASRSFIVARAARQKNFGREDKVLNKWEKIYDKLVAMPSPKLDHHMAGGLQLERNYALPPEVPSWKDPRDAYGFWQYGKMLERAGRHELAIKVLDRSLELEPAHGKVQGLRGYCLEKLGRTDEAAAAYKLAIQYNGSDSDPYYGLARLCNDPMQKRLYQRKGDAVSGKGSVF